MRTWVAGTFVALLTLGLVAGVGWFLFGGPTGPTREEQALRVAELYAGAWQDRDWEAAAALTDAPADRVTDAHDELITDLEITGETVTAGAVAVERGRADVALAVTVTLGGIGDWAYETTLVMLRDEGDWRVRWSPDTVHPELDEDRALQRRVVEPERAAILAHDGTPITEPGTVHRVGIHPARVRNPEHVVEAFDEWTDVDPEDVETLLDRGDLRDDWFYPVVTMSEEAFGEVEAALRPVPGIVFRTAPARITPLDGFARHIVGVTGEITAELLEELGDPYRPGDEVGLFGLERVFERELAGAPSAEIVLIERRHRVEPGEDPPDDAPEPVAVVHRFDGDAPTAVDTTLDIAVQTAVEEALDGVEDPTAVVVLDAGTGAIRGAASRPLEAFDRALGGRFPPGSSAKIITAAGAVLDGLDPGTSLDCPATTSVGGLTIRNADDLDLGATTLAGAFAASCNTTFAELGGDLGRGLADVAERFGFGAEIELPLPLVVSRYPTPDDRAEAGAAGIGQARVEWTPLHAASVAAAVAADGWRPPYLLDDAGPGGTRPLGEGVAEALTEMMALVVSDGTGGAAEVPGPPVHGKTGSAEFGERGEGGAYPTHAWFVGFRGDLAFAVLVEGGGAGGEVAAPIAARMLAALDATDDADSG